MPQPRSARTAYGGECLLLVAAFVAVHAAGLSLAWQHVAGDAMAAVTLLLLALLRNAERRAEHAVQRKLDAIASALPAQQEDRRATRGRPIPEPGGRCRPPGPVPMVSRTGPAGSHRRAAG